MTHRPSPTMYEYRQKHAAPGRASCAGLMPRADLVTMLSKWGPRKLRHARWHLRIPLTQAQTGPQKLRSRGPPAHNPHSHLQPPRLPPWEIFQRGPPEHQAATSHPSPHRKIFTKGDIPYPTVKVGFAGKRSFPSFFLAVCSDLDEIPHLHIC
jgi:hypothetical protein